MTAKEYLIDLAKRGRRREGIKEDWDLDYIVDGVRELVEDYDFTWDKQVIIPTEDKLFDDMFEAAKKFLAQNGVFNMSTGRILSLSEEEIEEGIRNMKTSLVMGEGKDAVTLIAREVEDRREPLVWAGNPGCPTPERLYYPIILSSAKEPVIDLLTCGSLVDVNGYQVKSGAPTELIAVRRELGISS